MGIVLGWPYVAQEDENTMLFTPCSSITSSRLSVAATLFLEIQLRRFHGLAHVRAAHKMNDCRDGMAFEDAAWGSLTGDIA